MFVGLELISIPTYVILFLGRGRGVLESGTKYFFLSVLSSAVLLYGFSFLYGAAGSTDLVEIRQALVTAAGAGRAWFASLALVLIFAGLGFRLTAVPFHFYAPDVYQGTTNPNAGLLAVVPKIAAVVALVRMVAVAMPGVERLGWQVSLALAHSDHDGRQPAGAVAAQRAATAGLFVDRACRLHADRPGGELCRRWRSDRGGPL